MTTVTRLGWLGTNQNYAYGGPYEVAYQAVPDVLTDVDSRDSRLLGYVVSNPTSGDLTFTIQTKDASPLVLPLGGVIAAGASASVDIPFGLLSKGGFSVLGSDVGLLFSIVWTH